MGHNHSHAHGESCDHHQAPKNYNFIFFFGISLNLIFVAAEATYGVLSNSMSLVADAGHNFSDVVGLVLAWVAFWLAKKKPTARFTYGLKKSSILSALLNAVILLIAVGAIMWEAIHRFFNPVEVQSATVMIVATIGILINTGTALLFLKDRDHDINIRGAFLHMAADALISLGVVISAFIIGYTNWQWVDPFTSIVISLIIIMGTWQLLKDSVSMSMDAVPNGIDPEKVKVFLNSVDGVREVHDLHIWAMSTTETALTAHLVIQSPDLENKILKKITEELKEKFKIHHPTLQLELADQAFVCDLKSDEVV